MLLPTLCCCLSLERSLSASEVREKGRKRGLEVREERRRTGLGQGRGAGEESEFQRLGGEEHRAVTCALRLAKLGFTSVPSLLT